MSAAYRKESIGLGLRSARNAAGMTQLRLAQLSGVDRATISMIEIGRERPRADTLVRLADALNLAPSDLWSAAGEDAPSPEGMTAPGPVAPTPKRIYQSVDKRQLHPGLQDLLADHRMRLMLKITSDEEAMLRSIRTRSDAPLSREFFIDVLVAFRRHRDQNK